MKFRILFYSFACLLVLASCNLPAPAQPTVTMPPLPPTITATLPAVVTATPTFTLTPTLTAVPPSATPLPTQTPTLAPSQTPTRSPTQTLTKAPTQAPTTGFPQVPEAIRILQPGPNSSILSPVKVAGEADPTFEQHLLAKVSGENGQALNTKATTIQVPAGERGLFSLEIPFTVTREQPGRVAVWSTSPKDGGLVHFSSVEVTLKTGGTAISPAGQPANEVLVITRPALNATASGGKLLVQGWSGPVFENNLVVVLCGEGGSGKSDPFCGTADNILARTTTTIHAPDIGQPGPFSIEVSYHVSQAVSGRVAVYYTSPRDGYLVHLSSMPVRLNP
jgi:hypothetical protein